MAPSNDSEQALQILYQSIQVLRRGDRTRARHLALLAARLDPANERSWLIVAATASPKASVFYLNKALELNPGSEAAHKGLQWAADRLERLGSAPVVQAEISAQAESSGEITRPVAVRSKPQYLAQ